MVRHYGASPGRVSASKDTKPGYDYLCEISPSFDDWKGVVRTANELGLDVIVMPNDRASLEFAETVSPKAYVLSAACFEEYDCIATVAQAGQPVYLRVGGATLGEIETVIGIIRKGGVDDITLLYGHQDYPSGIAETNLGFLTCLKNTFGLPVGIAGHVGADENFALIAPLLYIPLGVTCIEKHISYDRSVKGEDFESALNSNEFALLVKRIRQTEAAMGHRHAAGLDKSSAFYRHNVRKRVVATHDIKAGQRIERSDLAAKRADEGVSPIHIDCFVGQIAASDIPMETGMVFGIVRGHK